MEIKIVLTKQHWRDYMTYVEKTLPKSRKHGFWVNFFIWFLIAAVFFAMFQQYSVFHMPTALAFSGFFIIFYTLLIFNSLVVRKSFEPSEEGVFCGEHTFYFNKDGIETNSLGFSSQHSWKIVKKVERTQGMILVFIDTASAFIFPEDQLEDPEQFYQNLLQSVEKE